MNQGMLMEAMNLAASWNLPVLFVCRDNGISITTDSASVTGGDLEERVRGLGVPGRKVDGADVEIVWRTAGEMIDRARRGRGPAFLRATCVRPEGHFLGDPLLRMMRRPVAELTPRMGPLISAATNAEGGPTTQRAAGLGRITSMLGRTARTHLGPTPDPVRRLRKRLTVSGEAVAELEHAVEKVVETIIAQALRSRTAVDDGGAPL
jgi:hypothetical protein